MSFVVLALALLALRLVPGKPQTTNWHPLLDPLLIFACGVGSATLIQWAVPFHMPSGSITASDFPEYCDCILALADGHTDLWSGNRSTFPTRLPAFFYNQFGVLDGFLAAAITSSALTAMGIALWARALYSRLAAVLASLFMVAFSPLVISSRMINLYPEIGAILALGAGSVALALRYPHWATLLFASFAGSLTLLGELRGIIWALPLIGVLGLCALRGERRGIPIRMACVLLPLVLIHQLGKNAYPEGTSPLEHQVNLQFRFAEMGLKDARYQPPWDVADSHYVWGRSALGQIPKTLSYLRNQRRYVPDYESVKHLEDGNGGKVTRHWLPTLPFAALIALIGLRKRPWVALALLATTLPFVVSLQGTILASRSVLRFLANALIFAPVLLGVAGAFLAQGGLDKEEAPATGLSTWRGPAAAAIILAMVLGIVPSSLSPTADWRSRIQRPDGILDLQWYTAQARGEAVPEPGPKALSTACAAALESDAENDRPTWVRTRYSHLGAWKAGQPKTAPMGDTEPR